MPNETDHAELHGIAAGGGAMSPIATSVIFTFALGWRAFRRESAEQPAAHGYRGPLVVIVHLTRGGRELLGDRPFGIEVLGNVGVRSSLRLADVDHPRDAELVYAHAELIAPHLLLQWD